MLAEAFLGCAWVAGRCLGTARSAILTRRIAQSIELFRLFFESLNLRVLDSIPRRLKSFPCAPFHTFRKMRLRYSSHTGTKQTAVKLIE